jgi:hypothetical protein
LNRQNIYLPVDSKDQLSTIIDRENPLKSANSESQKDKGSKSTKIDEDSEPLKEGFLQDKVFGK